nr:putative short transient receptor potential channel 2-like protein isoform X3 [Macaca fascicularis]
MAPVKISHVVSFSSQDPRYPVENLLNPDNPRRPWLSCPQDKSGQLKVELQLERAVPIGYIDVGNCGCAFLQIDVGRSSWPLDRPFVTLLPATMLMSLTDSKQGKNRSGVRMFKDVDFLAPASGELWDRLRLTCSQPFTRHQSFGLAFLRVRSSLDSLDDSVLGPSALVSSVLNKGSDAQESGPSPWLANPSIRRTFFPHPHTDTKEISELRNILTQMQPGTLGRSAHMVLSAARKVPPVSVASPKNNHAESGSSPPDRAEPRAEEQNSENDVGRMKRRKVQHQRPVSNSNSRPNRRETARARQKKQHRPQAQSSGDQDSGLCPICADRPTPTTNSMGALHPTNMSLRPNCEPSMVPGTGVMKKSPAPAEQLGRLLKIPVLKFLLHSASCLWFLIFLLGESLVVETQLSTFRGRSQSVWETSLHMIWVTGEFASSFAVAVPAAKPRSQTIPSSLLCQSWGRAVPGKEQHGSYCLHIINALVQRYIETAWRKFKETQQKVLPQELWIRQPLGFCKG